jgi:hypothetical protein
MNSDPDRDSANGSESMQDTPPAKEQRLLRNARREGLLIMAVWAAALVWTVSYCYHAGYHRPVETVALILGMPNWVFWGVVLPWGICFLFATWFCFGYMKDDDLGEDPQEGSEHE